MCPILCVVGYSGQDIMPIILEAIPVTVARMPCPVDSIDGNGHGVLAPSMLLREQSGHQFHKLVWRMRAYGTIQYYYVVWYHTLY
jgi:hypothetical protein